MNANQRIEDLAKNFVRELQAIARDELMRVLGGGGEVVSRRANGASRPTKGQKRSAEALDRLQERVATAIRAQPGLRVEQLNKELAVETGVLALPIRKLLAAKVIRSSGARRATKYFATGATKRPKKKSKS